MLMAFMRTFEVSRRQRKQDFGSGEPCEFCGGFDAVTDYAAAELPVYLPGDPERRLPACAECARLIEADQWMAV